MPIHNAARSPCPPVRRPLSGFGAAARRAFTMIELLTVIAIIGIVSGIVVIGLNAAGRSRQEDQTVALLTRLNNAMAELTVTAAGSHKMFTIQLPNIYFPEPGNDFPDSPNKSWIGVPASALESQARTALVFDQIIAMSPSGKAFLAELPPERRGKFTTVGGTLSYTPRNPVPLDAWGNPIVFVFDNLQIATGTNSGRPFTVDLGGGPQTEVGGLTNLYSDVEKTFYEPANPLTPPPTYALGTAGAGQQLMPNPPATYTRPPTYTPRVGPTNQREFTLRSPDRRPFWMSAGPDGKYETHDDNVYSFGH